MALWLTGPIRGRRNLFFGDSILYITQEKENFIQLIYPTETLVIRTHHMLLCIWFELIRLLHLDHVLKRICWLVETLSFCNSAAASFTCNLMSRWSSEPLPWWENAGVAPPRNFERAKLSLWSTIHSCLTALVPSSVMGSAELRGQVA